MRHQATSQSKLRASLEHQTLTLTRLRLTHLRTRTARVSNSLPRSTHSSMRLTQKIHSLFPTFLTKIEQKPIIEPKKITLCHREILKSQQPLIRSHQIKIRLLPQPPNLSRLISTIKIYIKITTPSAMRSTTSIRLRQTSKQTIWVTRMRLPSGTCSWKTTAAWRNFSSWLTSFSSAWVYVPKTTIKMWIQPSYTSCLQSLTLSPRPRAFPAPQTSNAERASLPFLLSRNLPPTLTKWMSVLTATWKLTIIYASRRPFQYRQPR